MQSYSIQHCILLFLSLTCCMAPTLAFSSVMVKLNQSAVLPCHGNQSGSLTWSVIDKPGVIVAWCNQTSCWSEEGFNISHHQYLKGNLSLTITAADYTNRGLYTCESDGKDFNTVQISIKPRIFFIDLKPGEDLTLDLPMPGHLSVTYKEKDSSDQYGQAICSVNQTSVQCDVEYTPRVRLRDPKLILESVKPSDSGVYTIWSKQNPEILLSYIVSVTEPPPIRVQYHQSVTLNCTREDIHFVNWTHNRKPVAWCDQMTCGSEEGYIMKADFSLTISADDYSKRGHYYCTSGGKDIAHHQIIIETENVSVQLKPGEDLMMELPVAEQVQVIYNGSVIYLFNPADDQQYKGYYTHRIMPTLRLQRVTLTDSGVYTIQSKSEGIQNTPSEVFIRYSVSVEEGHSSQLSMSIWILASMLGFVFGLT